VIAPEGTQLCVGKTLPLIVNTTRSNYFWYRNDTIQAATINNGFQVAQPGLYRAATTNEFGCTNKTVNTLAYQFVFNNPTLLFEFDQSCEKTPINFINKTDTSRTGKIDWKWIFNKRDSISGYKSTFTFTESGTQLVQLKASSVYCGYSFVKDSLILIRKPEAATRMATVYTYRNTAKQLQARKPAGINYQYRWIPSFGLNNGNISNPVFNFNINQQYIVQLISPQGCVTADTLQVHVFEPDLVDIFVPKSFSPNGDGSNDLLHAYPAGIKELRYFRIYNKSGALLFQTRNLSEAWDGRFNGAPQPLGVYVWAAEAIDQNGKIIQKQGTFILLR
jgi:gliding motility-associated-like protein